MVVDGDCLVGTLDNLREGVAGTRAMPQETLAKIRTDALDLLDQVLETYERRVSPGEVGAGATAKASGGTARPEMGPTGLLYGRVQSGKTMAMIAFCAAALDNGFRVIVVLTSDYLKLVEQTARRFSALAGPLVKSSTAIQGWRPDVRHVEKQVHDHGVVLVCAKNQSHLETLVSFLQDIKAAEYPALILDDEADQASLDTTTAARSRDPGGALRVASTINRRTVRNDDPSEEGESIRERLPHHIYLQVTATPYALLLQNSDNPLRPSFTKLLEPGAGYTGGEAFFDAEMVELERPPLVFVAESEGESIQKGLRDAPDGLQKAIAFFLVSAGAQAIADRRFRAGAQNFLCHTSAKQLEHQVLADLIRSYLDRLGDDVRQSPVAGESGTRLGWAYDELRKTLVDIPSFEDIQRVICARLPRREIVIVNSSNRDLIEFGPELNFIVGGNILGRGLTIENLLVTYYLRRAKTTQMDTVLQHARMFGYRAELMPYTRVFVPESLAFRFNSIHAAEERLRRTLASAEIRRIPVLTPAGLRATRRNVLDTSSLSGYSPGDQVYPSAPELSLPILEKNNPRIEAALKEISGGALRPKEFIDVPLADLIRLMRMVPYSEEDAGNWDPVALEQVLSSLSKENGGRGLIYYRQMNRRKRRLTTGATEGEELKEARDKEVPVLFLFRDPGKVLGHEFWYPTVVLPQDMPAYVFNIT